MPAFGLIMIGGTAFVALAAAAEVWLYSRLHPLVTIASGQHRLRCRRRMSVSPA